MAARAPEPTGQPRLAWRILVYLAAVALAVPLLRGNDRISHGGVLAQIAVVVLHLAGAPATRSGSVISGGGFAMEVAPVCDGADLAVILCMAMLLSPVPWRLRLSGALAAVALTQIFNLGRLVCMFLIGRYLPQYFDLFHQVLWQAVAILFCVGLYAAWLGRAPSQAP